MEWQQRRELAKGLYVTVQQSLMGWVKTHQAGCGTGSGRLSVYLTCLLRCYYVLGTVLGLGINQWMTQTHVPAVVGPVFQKGDSGHHQDKTDKGNCMDYDIMLRVRQ